MPDPRFHALSGPKTLGELALIAKAELGEGCDADAIFKDVAALDTAGGSDIGFFDNRKYLDAFKASRAGACIAHPNMAKHAPDGMALLLSEEPYHGFARISRAFYPLEAIVPGIHDRACVDEGAVIGNGSRIEAGAVIGRDVEIGENCLIGPNTVVEPGVVIGDETRIGSLVSLSNCRIGSHVTILTGARVGQDGFGFALGPSGYLKVPQLGRVIIEDNVDIGANTTIDRGAGPDTVIGTGTIIDNMVQIAHNVVLGKGCVIAAHVGVSGSTKIGDYVMIGGQAGFAGHLNIGTGARIAAQAGVIRDLDPGVTVVGSPALPGKQFWREVATLSKLSQKKK